MRWSKATLQRRSAGFAHHLKPRAIILLRVLFAKCIRPVVLWFRGPPKIELISDEEEAMKRMAILHQVGRGCPGRFGRARRARRAHD